MSRSLFFTYTQSGNFLANAKGKLSVPLKGWQASGRWGNLIAVDCPINLGTWPIKFYAQNFVDAFAPALNVVRVDEKVFADFLKNEHAENESWTLRFWEIDQKKEWSRAITMGREEPSVYNDVVKAMTTAGRATVWAGAEFTHPKFDQRVMMHRWPTAAISPWGKGGSEYQKVKDRFINLLKKVI